jgi:hypothetical protein
VVVQGPYLPLLLRARAVTGGRTPWPSMTHLSWDDLLLDEKAVHPVPQCAPQAAPAAAVVYEMPQPGL